MNTITLQEAQAALGDILHRLAPGERITITEDDQPVGELVVPFVFAQRSPRPRPAVTGVPQAGSMKGKIWMADDFDAPLEELRDYME
jgi:antitoxin (DNA-binding transcriptional repressor) of toxin-antitoxin stability system